MGEKPMPDTLNTIAEKITALGKSIDDRFTKVDRQFAKIDQQFAKIDQQFAEVKAHLDVTIEAVEHKVDLVYDAVIALQQHETDNAKAQEQFALVRADAPQQAQV